MYFFWLALFFQFLIFVIDLEENKKTEFNKTISNSIKIESYKCEVSPNRGTFQKMKHIPKIEIKYPKNYK